MRYIAGIIVLAFVLAGCGGAPVASVPAATAAPTQPPTATATPKPTNTPEPTSTPRPTNTPEPTATPTAIPTPTPLPEPIQLQGKGDTVTDPFKPPAGITRVVATHKGKSNFIVYAYAEDGDKTLVANAIGNYTGSRPLVSDGPIYLEVKADGPWSIQVEPIPDQPEAAQGLSGSGDFVSGFFMPAKTGPVPFVFHHTGRNNFIVYVHCAGGTDLAANEIGAVEGSQSVVQFRKGPCLWDVQADGDWGFQPK